MKLQSNFVCGDNILFYLMKVLTITLVLVIT